MRKIQNFIFAALDPFISLYGSPTGTDSLGNTWNTPNDGPLRMWRSAPLNSN